MTLPALAWLDIETTGLDEHRCAVLEVGIVLTGWNLEPIAERSWVLHFDGPVDPLIAQMHGPDGSGLLGICRQVPWGAAQVAEAARDWLADHDCDLTGRDKLLLAGRNAHFDRRFLRHHLPRLEAALSHRNLDVSTLRLACQAWAGLTLPKPEGPHRSLADLHQDLAVARACKERFGALVLPEAPSCPG